MAETMQSLDQLSHAEAGRARGARNMSRSSTSRAAPMPPASARTRSPASGSSRAPARSPSTPATVEVFFARPVLRMLIQQPLVAANRKTQYDVICTVSGGGLSGQAGAVRHGISKALTYFEPDLRARAQEAAASSPATRAWSSARSTAGPRPAVRSSSPSAERDRSRSKSVFTDLRKGCFGTLFVFCIYATTRAIILCRLPDGECWDLCVHGWPRNRKIRPNPLESTEIHVHTAISGLPSVFCA